MDYEAVSGTLTFDPGQRQAVISVPLKPPSPPWDYPKTFSVELARAEPGLLLSPFRAIDLTLIAKAIPVGFAQEEVVVSEADGVAVVPLTLPRPGEFSRTAWGYQANVRVRLGGTAVPEKHYHISRSSRDLSFYYTYGAHEEVLVGPTSLEIQLFDDLEIEGERIIELELAQPSGLAVLASGTRARVRIVDDDTTNGPKRGPNGPVADAAVAPDNRWLILGRFTSVDGRRRLGMARLLPHGEVDPTFFGLPPVRLPQRIAPDYRGGVLFSGCEGVRRLRGDGTPDWSFKPPRTDQQMKSRPWCRGPMVESWWGRSPHKELHPSHTLIRLLPDGSSDRTFRARNPDNSPLTYGFSCSVIGLLDGDILLGTDGLLVRLKSDGRLRHSYAAAIENRKVLDLLEATAGRVWALTWHSRNGSSLLLLHPEGTFETFSVDPANFLGGLQASSLDEFPDLVAGGTSVTRLRRDATGQWKHAHPPVPADARASGIPLPGGRLFLFGWFQGLGGLPRRYLAFLNTSGTVIDPLYLSDQSVLPDGRFRFRVAGQTQWPWVLETSSDWQGWTPMVTNQGLSGTFEWIEEQPAAVSTTRLFRATPHRPAQP